MDPKALRRIERTNYILTVLAAGVGAALLGRSYALGLGFGALVGSVNFSAIRWLVERWTASATERRAGTAFLFIPKMTGLIAVVFVAIRYMPISPVFFAIGFSLFFISIAIETVRFATRAPDEQNGEAHTS